MPGLYLSPVSRLLHLEVVARQAHRDWSHRRNVGVQVAARLPADITGKHVLGCLVAAPAGDKAHGFTVNGSRVPCSACIASHSSRVIIWTHPLTLIGMLRSSSSWHTPPSLSNRVPRKALRRFAASPRADKNSPRHDLHRRR